MEQLSRGALVKGERERGQEQQEEMRNWFTISRVRGWSAGIARIRMICVLWKDGFSQAAAATLAEQDTAVMRYTVGRLSSLCCLRKTH